MDEGELLGGDDPPLRFRDGRGLDAGARVQGGDLVVERRGEDGRQHGQAVLDRGRLHPGVFQRGEPGADIGGLDRDHLVATERGQDVLVQDVAVVLPGGELDLVVGKPLLLDVAGQDLPASSGVGVAALRGVGLGALPRFVRPASAGEAARRPAPAGDVVVVSRVAGLAVGAETFA